MVIVWARGMHHANATMVTIENCIMAEAERELDCLEMKKILFAGATVTENLNVNTKY